MVLTVSRVKPADARNFPPAYALSLLVLEEGGDLHIKQSKTTSRWDILIAEVAIGMADLWVIDVEDSGCLVGAARGKTDPKGVYQLHLMLGGVHVSYTNQTWLAIIDHVGGLVRKLNRAYRMELNLPPQIAISLGGKIPGYARTLDDTKFFKTAGPPQPD